MKRTAGKPAIIMSLQLTSHALNHLLTQNSWALPRLARFAGKTARFDIAPFSFAYTILGNGTLQSADAAASADAVCVVSPALLPHFALHGTSAQSSLSADTKNRQDGDRTDAADTQLPHVETLSEGDTALLTEILFLSRNLRWDAAEDLSNIIGDIAAERIVQTIQAKRQQLRDTILNLSQAAAEYCTEEYPLLTNTQQAAAFTQQVNALCGDMARLEQRISHLPSSSLVPPTQVARER